MKTRALIAHWARMYIKTKTRARWAQNKNKSPHNPLSPNVYKNENKNPLSPHNLLSPWTNTNLIPLSPCICKNTNLSPLSPCTNTNLSLLIIHIKTWKYSPKKCTEPARCTNAKLKDVLKCKNQCLYEFPRLI